MRPQYRLIQGWDTSLYSADALVSIELKIDKLSKQEYRLFSFHVDRDSDGASVFTAVMVKD